jgi:hypothetical protein
MAAAYVAIGNEEAALASEVEKQIRDWPCFDPSILQKTELINN